MYSDNDFLPKQDSLSQPLPIKTKANNSWKALLILLIMFHLPLAGLLIDNLIFILRAHYGLEYMLAGLIQGIYYFPLLLPLAIMDYFAVRSYRKKQSPPWKGFFIFLAVINVIFFSFVGWAFIQPPDGPTAIVIWFLGLCLLVFDFITMTTYVSRLPDFKAKKVIFYTTLTLTSIIVLGLLLGLSVFYYSF